MSAVTVAQALEEHRETLGAAARVLVGFSGGLDSTVLLHALHASTIARPIALHMNHGLHGDAARWEAHCGAVCETLGISHLSTDATVVPGGRGLEAAAREMRYAWFEQQLEAGDCLLLAHHQDDQAETLLLRLLRGTGPDGLAAMPATRDLGRGTLLRPFLGLPRSDLVAYGQRHGLSWIDDPSNDDEHFDRNYLRGQVLPLIEARWPGYRGVLSRAAGLLREQRQSREALALQPCYSLLGDPGFACVDLPEDPAIAALAVRAWLHVRSLAMPAQARLREFLRQLRDGEGASLATRDWTLTRYRDAVFAHRPAPFVFPASPLAQGQVWNQPGVGELSLQPAAMIPAGAGEEGADGALAPAIGELVVRGRTGGERIAVAAGHHQSLKAVFQERGVPPWWRDRMPLLFERRDGQEELLAVGGLLAAPRLRKLGLELSWRPDALE